MARWLLSFMADRALVAVLLLLAYLAWGDTLHRPLKRALALATGAASPYAHILRALE